MAFYSLPYYPDPMSLPPKLPTVKEIDPTQDIPSDQLARKVVGIADHFVVKYGVGADLLKGKMMLFLQQSTSIPVPRVYAWFHLPDTKKNHIIVGHISGTALDLEWPKMDQAAKNAVVSKHYASFEEIRRLKSLGGFCSLGRRSLPNDIFWTSNPSNPFAGPFDTEPDLNEARVGKYVKDGLPKYKMDFYACALKTIFRDYVPIFSQGDLQRENVMIRRSHDASQNEEQLTTVELEIVIIDWEFAGWYPSYLEYVRAIFACGRWADDWSLCVDGILVPALNEYARMVMFLREMWSRNWIVAAILKSQRMHI
ncbi:hypothetical protein K469DRAFT_560419 [Zopfia rhizophila CBS 207.26]|uniref:Aminoglycoside phosphotransferase domain-containing protein n=1 Tax=Zopfia rhizophila CBS 207.26 TaxID=1314779 RepID=A0A6A6EIR3_9PEZI|nr:hypothetical protein K469DRAFT_560419 [Zopfia rhizophila CBS 207.26]